MPDPAVQAGADLGGAKAAHLENHQAGPLAEAIDATVDLSIRDQTHVIL